MAEKKTSVWPVIQDVKINDHTAVFTGIIHRQTGRVLELFAYEPPGSPVDITQKTFELNAKQRGEGLSQVPGVASPSTLKTVEGGVEIGFSGWGGSKLKVSWTQIAAFIRQGREQKVERKEGRYGTIYLELVP